MQSKENMQAFVFNMLKAQLSPYYYYHNFEHTLYVLDKVEEIGMAEKCTEEEIKLLKVAALWHDIGFIHIYINHEQEGCRLAKQYLPSYDYSESQIQQICGMIMATKLPQSPTNKLEEIIADADLEYLGTAFATERAEDLYKELNHLNPLLTRDQWNHTQVAFIRQHKYFTKYCREKREPQKLKYLDQLEVGSS